MTDALLVLLALLATAAAAVAAAGWGLRRMARGRREPSDGDPSVRAGSASTGSGASPPGTSPERTARSPDDEGGPLPGHDLRFTVYRPRQATPGRWHDLLVFMHEMVPPSTRLPTQLRARARIEREVRSILGEDAPTYTAATEDAAEAVPREGQLTFVVKLPGFRVNPPRQTVGWHEDLQHLRFRIRADPGRTGRTVRGRLTVFHGPLILAEMALVIPVGHGEDTAVSEALTPYRRIFASYAREDDGIVRRVSAFAASVGDRYLRDVTSLRAGEEWNPGLARLIQQADLFQLFWSWNAMESEWVRREWTHALSLGRTGFVRPVYWEDPLPSRPEEGLPPPELSELHFHRLPRTLVEGPPADESASIPAASTPSPPRARRRLPGALSAVAVAILALGTSTVIWTDRPSSSVAEDLSDPEGAAGPIPPNGVLVAEVTLDEAPLGNVRVRVEASDGQAFEAVTEPDGEVTFPDLPPGPARVTVPGPPDGTGLAGSPPEVVVPRDDSVRVTLGLTRRAPRPPP